MSDVGVYPESMQEDWRKSPAGDFVSRQWLLTEYDKRHKGPPGGARKMIEEAPPADVRPVKQGEWMMRVDSVFNGERFVEWFCSECGYVRNRGWRHTNDGKVPDAKFCENCGADMRTIGQRLSDISAEEDLFPELTAEEKAENKAEAKRMIGGADG